MGHTQGGPNTVCFDARFRLECCNEDCHSFSLFAQSNCEPNPWFRLVACIQQRIMSLRGNETRGHTNGVLRESEQASAGRHVVCVNPFQETAYMGRRIFTIKRTDAHGIASNEQRNIVWETPGKA